MPRLRGGSILIVGVLAVLACGPLDAQLTQVNVMPGAPHLPRTAPHPARPGVPTLVWGNANGGGAGAIGSTYTWSFSPNPNVAVTDDGSLTGTVTDPRFIVEEVTFTLLGGSTNETILATLSVTDTFSTTIADSVYIQIIDPADPSSNPQTASLQIDVNIAIENGLRRLYLMQGPSGAWPGAHPCAETGFALWCFGNMGHLPTTPVASDDDIYAETVQRGLDAVFNNLNIDGTVALNADTARGAIANGVSDLNGNGRSIRPCGTNAILGYEVPIVTAGIIASLSPSRIVTTGPFTGDTYKTIVEDIIDFIGTQQNSGPSSGPRGGWTYSGPGLISDMSINSWMFVAMEGAEDTNFSITVPDWIKQEAEYALVFHQTNAAGPQLFGYNSTAELVPGHGRSTTAAGLSGLALVETESIVTPGSIIAAEPPPLNTIAAKRQAALDRLGDVWNVDSLGSLGEGNRGNFYTMWTVARTLRITAQALALPVGQKVPLVNGGVTFDWEFGEESGSPGIVPGFGLPANVAGPPREGYFNWLVRNQDNSNANLYLRGRWNEGTFMSYYGASLETSLGTLVLIPEVFGHGPCADVTNLSVQCDLSDPTGSTFVVSFDVTNNSSVPVSHIVFPTTSTVPGAPVTVSPNVFPQSPSLAPGDTTSISLTIHDATGGSQVCFRMGMLDENFEECCGKDVCVDLPVCECLLLSNESVVCDPNQPGAYLYQFTITNVSSFTAENTFLLGNPTLPAGVTFNPDSFNYPPVPPGGTVTLSTQILGAVPGQMLCFQTTVHDANLIDCCAIDHCLTLPSCGNPPCIADLACTVENGQILLTWTPPTDQCCLDFSLTLPDGSQIAGLDPFAGAFTVPGACAPGEYCLTCMLDPTTGEPPTTICCTIEDTDCADPCIPDVVCEPMGDFLLLTWTPPANPQCCGELQISFNGAPLTIVDPQSGSYMVPQCQAGTYCIQCVGAGGAGTPHCCTIDVACNAVTDPVVTTVPPLSATVGTPYGYLIGGYLPGQDPTMISYDLITSPSGATIDPAGGQIQWTPDAAQTGDQDFLVRLTAGTGMTEQAWTVVVGTPLTAGPLFLRGDCSVDGSVDVADAIGILSMLFGSTGPADCADACDVNDSGTLDISDAIFLLAHLFNGGQHPAEPYSLGCGSDPTDDTLGCAADGACP